MSRSSNIAYHPAARPREEQEGEASRASPIRKDAAPAPERSSNLVDERIQEELETLRRWIDLSVRVLVQDPILRHRHAAEIENLGRVEKILHRIGNVVAAADRGAVIDALDMPELKARLQRRALEPIFEAKH